MAIFYALSAGMMREMTAHPSKGLAVRQAEQKMTKRAVRLFKPEAADGFFIVQVVAEIVYASTPVIVKDIVDQSP